MRLIKLRIRNIASLKGEHEIDFQEIQKESPLFAITGETGAGKSTILNCIALALYGDVYKSNVYQPDVVTLGEKEAAIELIFGAKGKYYFADWRIRVLKNNGEKYSKDPTALRLLYTMDGSEFTSPKTVTNTTAEELLNLDFKQFCKCIILNQGEFARFLTSTFHERKEILEKLYPGDLLDNISRELEQEKKALEKEKHDLEIELHTLKGDNLSGEELKAQKENLGVELKKQEESFKRFEELNQHFMSLLHYFDKYHENEKRKHLIKEEISVVTTKLNLLLKEGEELQERFQLMKSREESEVPILQTFLEKESTLRHLEEGWTNLKSQISELTLQLEMMTAKAQTKEADATDLEIQLTNVAKIFSRPPKELAAFQKKLEETFEIFSEKEFLEGEIKGRREKLHDLEARGLELKEQVEKLKLMLPQESESFENQEKELLQRKAQWQLQADTVQRTKIAAEEEKKQTELLEGEMNLIKITSLELSAVIEVTRQEIAPLEITVKLQELANAREICLEHAMNNKLSACPVCEVPIETIQWRSLLKRLDKADILSINKKLEENKRELSKKEQELGIIEEELKRKNELHRVKLIQRARLEDVLKKELPSIIHLDQEIDELRKKNLERIQMKKDCDHKNLEREKLRNAFKQLRDELAVKESLITRKDEMLTVLQMELSAVLPEVSRETIRDMRRELSALTSYLGLEAKLNKVQQEKIHVQERMQECAEELSRRQKTQQEQLEKIRELKEELQTKLGDTKAAVLIQRIMEEKKLAELAWSRQREEQNKQEQFLTNARGRLASFEEHTKEFDLHYLKELHAVKEHANLGIRRSETSTILSKISRLELSFTSPRELFLPLAAFIKDEKDFYRNATNEVRMLLAGVSEKYHAWEILQDKIQLREIKLTEIQGLLNRKLRLFEVIGKDDLRTFVLSLVEESLIQQTNEELQKLCQGRYEIVHQTKAMKMTPEFFILDKFREGGRRKVSTLSGGETFMVSIAMALGLAEMTRGQAEIDSLFIDEGFGTLDQDSLDDVLDMLQQIQTRGLMVGIISHIRPLTEALAMNILLTKKSDGTSTISLCHN
jgi:exonuclease SbcC